MSEEMNIFQKIADVKANIEGFTKDTNGFNYKYVSGSQILHRIRQKMIEHRLLLVPHLENETCEQTDITRYNHKAKREVTNTEFIVKTNLTYTWINADNPKERLDIPFYAVGQQADPSQAFGTALTYSERYFLMKFFNIPTDEDDADAKQKQEQFSKANNNQIKLLNEEIQNFQNLMISLNKKVTESQIRNQFKIPEDNKISQAQAIGFIKQLQITASKYKEEN
ncbi:ERF family protein [uncultured Staphylococcus sp.]|uniref:ERF family protein n=1 Tax=uncultured Staphylococcus sp. TaxID=189668 RepID=UPI0025E136CC|nr:ERF family protein [uncultured Staphylococcus sp.]